MVIPGGVAEKDINAFLKARDMSEALTLPAELRERAGKGASRELRRDGRVPAVIYGGKEQPLAIHVEDAECACAVLRSHGFTILSQTDISR